MLNHKKSRVVFTCLLVLLLAYSLLYELPLLVTFGVILFWMIFTMWGAFDIRSQYFVKTYCNNPDEVQRKISITFDDGPTQYTNAILDILQQHNVKAAFFCIGSQIEKYPEVFKRIIAEGHIVGNHSYSHSKGIGFFSTNNVLLEIQKNDNIIKSILIKSPNLYRPPFGVTNPMIARAVASTGHKVIGWNIRSLDTIIKDEDKIVHRIKKKMQPGGVVLLHDTSTKTANALEQLLVFLHFENYIVTPVDELLNIKSYED